MNTTPSNPVQSSQPSSGHPFRTLVEMARAAQHDDRQSTGTLYGKLADRIEELEAALLPFAAYRLRAVGFNGVFSKVDMEGFQWMAGFDGPQPEYRHFANALAALPQSSGVARAPTNQSL